MKTIRSLERGLCVLKILDEHTGLTLAELAARTNLAKPTLMRILLTLEESGMTWKAIGDGRYRRCLRASGKSRLDERAYRIAEVAAPHLDVLQRTVIWPSDLLIYRNYRLELVETSRRQSNLGLFPYRIGFRINMFLSAPGRAWLAFCSERDRDRIIAHAQSHPELNPRSHAVLYGELEAILAATRKLGYASRDPLFGGTDRDISEFDDGLDAIAVPIMDGKRILACMNLVWPRKYRLKEKIVRAHIKDLKAAADAIAESVKAM
ncbi:MAG: helix-turn-helix domain-containing protein [Proteobacteria bacterium]|nr:helix-turn-helix domain-containing protein [Pseudomonadota bacterium]